jgi:hypothetical protein
MRESTRLQAAASSRARIECGQLSLPLVKRVLKEGCERAAIFIAVQEGVMRCRLNSEETLGLVCYECVAVGC